MADDDFSRELAELRREIGELRKTLGETRSLVGPFGLPFPDGSILVQTIFGTKYFVPAGDFIMTPNLVVYRQWEPELSRFVANSVGPDDVFVDVGANIGYFTVLAASRMGAGGTGRVYAIEANPDLIPLLNRNVLVNWSMGPVDIFHCAATVDDRVLELFIPSSGAANGSLARQGTASGRSVPVRGVAIDTLLPKDLIANYLKIDVEGFELDVLNGARGLIIRSPDIKIIMEWSQGQMGDAGIEPQSVLEFLRQCGLQPFRIPPSDFADAAGWDEYYLPYEKLLEAQYDNFVFRRTS